MNRLASKRKVFKIIELSILDTIKYFRKSEDNLALDCFITIIDDLEILIEYFKFEEITYLKDIKEIIRSLVNKMENQDVIGLTDTVEFKLYPLISTWAKECENCDCC